jgi:hypothetical protein
MVGARFLNNETIPVATFDDVTLSVASLGNFSIKSGSAKKDDN